MKPVPFHRPWQGPEEEAALLSCLRSGWWTTGPEVFAFEADCAQLLEVEEAVALSSATAALELMLRVHDIGPGDEVITVALTFIATLEVILRVGARPRLVDVDPLTGCLDPEAAAAAITPRTRAVLVVHLGGHPARMIALQKLCQQRGLLLFEDAAHAFEAHADAGKVGAIADAAAFSFYANKNIATGEGGLLVVADPARRQRARLMRSHGMNRDAAARGDGRGYRGYDISHVGLKANMPDLAAALGRAQLKQLDAMTARRRDIVARYDAAFASSRAITLPARPQDGGHAWHLYAIALVADDAGQREALIDQLAERGVGCSVHYRPLHLMTAIAEVVETKPGDLPVSESWGRRRLSLPLFPALRDDEVEQVIEAVLASLEVLSS